MAVAKNDADHASAHSELILAEDVVVEYMRPEAFVWVITGLRGRLS